MHFLADINLKICYTAMYDLKMRCRQTESVMGSFTLVFESGVYKIITNKNIWAESLVEFWIVIY